ncbi:hypothetical protein D9615_009701 [Tricholomella constricta]|uniref:DUF6534 domain-containing protein n=1 Tax=Tricholomella constricta TaxID=117010 RepID=A0A8H5GUK9_9AGAR|nr:hypothetical protein D9615_009701 [Tricholomella constricta]
MATLEFGTFEKLLKISALTITINAVSTFVDIFIASTLCLLLNNARTGFKRSDSIINRLMLFVVNTGVRAQFPVYTNSLLATLNARNSTAGTIDNTSHMLVSLPPSIITPSGSTGGIETGHRVTQSKVPAPNISIRIDTTKESIHEARGLEK